MVCLEAAERNMLRQRDLGEAAVPSGLVARWRGMDHRPPGSRGRRAATLLAPRVRYSRTAEVGPLSERVRKRIRAQDRGQLVGVLDGTMFGVKLDDGCHVRRAAAR